SETRSAGRGEQVVAGVGVGVGLGDDERTCAEFGSTIRPDSSTNSSIPPVICRSCWSRSLSQRSSGTPLMYQFEPLSARNMPYRCSPVRITRSGAGYAETFTDDFSLTRAPIGGTFGSVMLDAWWRAGQMNELWVRTAVKRSAWAISPAATSS